MNRLFGTRPTAWAAGLALLTSFSGCYIPTWRIPNYEPCQCLENSYGDVVDHINHTSPIDRPWCDPEYVKRGVYRVAPPGSFCFDQYEYLPSDETELGDLKPEVEAPPPMLIPPE